MRIGIQSRLFFAFIGTISLVVVAMALAVNWSFERGLEGYLGKVELERMDRLVTTLSQAYGEQGDWEFLHHNSRAWNEIMDQSLGRPPGALPSGRPNDRYPAEQPLFPPHRPPPWHRPPPGERPLRPEYRGGLGAPPHDPAPFYPARDFDEDFGPMRAPPGPPPVTRAAPPPRDPLDLRPRLRLFDAGQALVFGPPRVEGEEIRRAIPWQGETVGFLALRTGEIVTDELALGFQAEQRRTYALIVVLSLLLSALASLLLARRMLRPIRLITAGAQALGAGRYATRIPVDRGDELGRLAGDFNHLAAALERNEQSRRRWVADISHELRTPLAILRGEIEALLDGVRQASPKHLQSLHGEVLGLGKLVDDLYELALSDVGALDYRREALDLAEVIADTVDGFHHRFAAKGVELVNRVQGPLPFTGDYRRLQQLFINLLENSHRYTDAGGRLQIDLELSGDWYHLLLQDTAPAVPDQALPQLFERLFRVDKSRSRSLGGAGLGLAICRNIAEAHGGRIEAAHSSLGGLALHLYLPAGERGSG